MAQRIPFPNAFTINKLGSGAFPLGLKYRHGAADVFTLHIYPQSVSDICDLLTEFALPQLVLFDVDQVSMLEEVTWRALSLREVTRAANFDCRAIDDTTIVLEADRLRPLLDRFSHYELSLFDAPRGGLEEDIIEQVIRCRDGQMKQPLLPNLTASTLWLSCHDDCYLHLEAREAALLKRVMARTLQIYAGTVLYEALSFDREIADVPIEMLESLLSADGNLTILRSATDLDDTTLRIGTSRRAFAIGESLEYPVETVISYAYADDRWISC